MPLKPLSEPESILECFLGFIQGSLFSVFLFSTLLAFNVVQTASLVIKLFSRTAFRRLNRWMANLWWGWCAIGAEKIYRIKFVMSGDDVPERENAIVVLNHQAMADIAVIFTLARSKKRLGDLKWFVKDILKYVPGVGWGMLFIDCLFVKRNWTDDHEHIQRIFDKILNSQIPLWLMIFAEGTRVSPSKIVSSQEYAKKHGFTPLKHVLIPRTKGFVATVLTLHRHVQAVYDVTIGYIEGVPTLWQWIKGYVQKVNVHVRRFPIDDLPLESEAISTWLVKLYEDKDVLLDTYYRNGVFPSKLPE
jgi:1-acyl-sn-glycerol-3-phosphate acyltransferase